MIDCYRDSLLDGVDLQVEMDEGKMFESLLFEK